MLRGDVPCTCALAQGGTMTGFDNCPRHRLVPVCEQCGEARRELPEDYVCREGAKTIYVRTGD